MGRVPRLVDWCCAIGFVANDGRHGRSKCRFIEAVDLTQPFNFQGLVKPSHGAKRYQLVLWNRAHGSMNGTAAIFLEESSIAPHRVISGLRKSKGVFRKGSKKVGGRGRLRTHGYPTVSSQVQQGQGCRKEGTRGAVWKRHAASAFPARE